METFREFVDRVLKRKEKRNHPRGNHPTIYECYNWVRDNCLKPAGVKGVNREEFYRIIKAVNLIVKDAYLDGYEFSFPDGVLMIKIKVQEGERYISWLDTLKAWYADNTLMEDQIHIKKNKEPRVAIVYGKVGIRIKNHNKYTFSTNRAFKIDVNNKFKEGNLEVL